jgi:hypothetical protein
MVHYDGGHLTSVRRMSGMPFESSGRRMQPSLANENVLQTRDEGRF